MAITRVKTSSILQNFPKERSMLAGNDGDTGAYESIATASGTGSSGTITFSNIPSIYTHLQIRAIINTTSSSTLARLQMNGDTTANYAAHQLYGDGANAGAAAYPNSNFAYCGDTIGSGQPTRMGVIIIDILDYANTNKFKTARTLSGSDNNGSGTIRLWSALWRSTSAVTSITLTSDLANWSSDSQFALYGIR